MIAKVKIAQKELRLDEATYRALLERVVGRSSAADCKEVELQQVLDEFKRLGWKPKLAGAQTGGGGAQLRTRPADHPSAKKARALWISLYHLGEVRNGSDAALEAFAKRQLRCERLQWADQGQVYQLIEALKAMAQRAGWDQNVAGHKRDHQVVVLKRRLYNCMLKKLGRPPFIGAATALDTGISLAATEIRELGGR